MMFRNVTFALCYFVMDIFIRLILGSFTKDNMVFVYLSTAPTSYNS